jgi:hypothetical protein
MKSIGAPPTSTPPRSSSSSAPAAGPKRVQPTFLPAKEKISIVSLDDQKLAVTAQYNPKELGINKTIQWNDTKMLDNQPVQNRKPAPGPDHEFTGGGARSMSIEMFFDRYEMQADKSQPPIEQLMDDLNAMASITDPTGKPKDRRPHYCLVVWGAGGIRPFRCVIESLDIKYTMFDTNGIPLRATATVKVKETAMQLEEHKLEKKDREVRQKPVEVTRPWDKKA